MTSETIEQQLTELSQRLDALPEVEEPPPTTLQVLGRSRREQYWQRLLVHFLTPGEAHGLDDDVLGHILTALSTRPDLDFQYSRLDLEDVRVQREVSTGQGRPDLVIWVPEGWFLCIEMKVDSSEGNDQTQRYVDVDSFDEIDLAKTDVPQDQHHYLYLAPQDAPSPDAQAFVPVSWEWLAEELQSFLTDSHGRYPSRTRAQLADFIDTIQTELVMTEYEQNRREKVALAIEYYEPMTEVLEMLEEHVETLNEEWPDWFLEQNPSSWNDNWHARLTGKTYNSVHRDEWAINYPGDDGNNKRSDLHIYWEFQVTQRHLGTQELEHQVVVTGQDKTLKEPFRETIYSDPIRQEVMDTITALDTESRKDVNLQDRDDWNDRTYERIIKANYEFDFNGGEGFKRRVIEAFEDFQPIFESITASIPNQ